MDKLRALQYFVASAEKRSFSAAARHFEVSVPAVSKLITALERDLRASLFDRAAKGLTLTADGEAYLDACRPILEQLAGADAALSGAASRPHGMLVVGAPAFVAQSCLLPALPRFHTRYPDIQIDLRVVNRLGDPEASAADVFVLAGWPESEDLISRPIAQGRFLVCASPGYWAAHGVPQEPKDLARHQCLLLRNPGSTVLDLWRGDWKGKDESVTVSGWLMSSHRDVLLDAVLAGEGVIRASDLTTQAPLRSGRLVPVLLEWVLRDAPPINLLFRPKNRRTPRVRLFVDFVTELFLDLQAERDKSLTKLSSSERPYWYQHSHGRASAAIRRL